MDLLSRRQILEVLCSFFCLVFLLIQPRDVKALSSLITALLLLSKALDRQRRRVIGPRIITAAEPKSAGRLGDADHR